MIVLWKASGLALTHRNGGLSCAGLAGYQHGSAGDVAVFDHLQNDPRCPAGGQLADHSLRHLQVERNRRTEVN